MKLLFCPDCEDVVKLQSQPRTCKCGASGGRYLDEIKAEIWGKAVAIGFWNPSFAKALRETKNLDLGKEFTAFVFGESAFKEGRIRRIKQ